MSRLRELQKRIERIEKELELGKPADGGPFVPKELSPGQEQAWPRVCSRCGANKNQVCFDASCPQRTEATCGPSSQSTVNLEVKSSLPSEAAEEAKKVGAQAAKAVKDHLINAQREKIAHEVRAEMAIEMAKRNCEEDMPTETAGYFAEIAKSGKKLNY